MVGTLGIGEPPSAGVVGSPDPLRGWTATGLTTPDPAALHGGLAAYLEQGVQRCAIEASSIGLAEHRLQALHITVALFTNFTQDHLDYHHNLDQYWAAKRQLFDWPQLSAAVINVDDPRGASLYAQLRAQRPSLDLWSVGLAETARLQARGVQATATGMRFELHEAPAQGGGLKAPPGPMGGLSVLVPFLGNYNLLNLLGVVAGLRALGHPLADIAAVLPQLSAVPGRLQAQGGAGEPLAVVDYAHTPDALEKALAALRTVAQERGGRLWCVFGCGGDRDRAKRPLMGAVAARGADIRALTTAQPAKHGHTTVTCKQSTCRRGGGAEGARGGLWAHGRQGLQTGRGWGAKFGGQAQALLRHQGQRLVIAQGGQPGPARGRATQSRNASHVGVVAQALAGALRTGHPGQAIAIHHRQAHQLARKFGQAVQQGLRRIHDAGVAEITQAHGDQLGGEQVIPHLAGLAHIAAAGQVGQQAMGRAFRNVQALGNGGQLQPFAMGAKQLQNTQRSLEHTVHGVGSVSNKDLSLTQNGMKFKS